MDLNQVWIDAHKLLADIEQQVIDQQKWRKEPLFLVLCPQDYAKLVAYSIEWDRCFDFNTHVGCFFSLSVVLVEGAKPRVVLGAFQEYERLYEKMKKKISSTLEVENAEAK